MAFYFFRHQQQPLVLVFSPKCACSSVRSWFLNSHRLPAGQRFEIQRSLIPPQALEKLTDHERVFFLRDPLRRLVSFYARWVVQAPLDKPTELLGSWCFADMQRRFYLHDKTFRQFLFVLVHLRQVGLAAQHHLEPQLQRVPREHIDRVILTEQLDTGLEELNQRFGFTHEGTATPRVNTTAYDLDLDQPAADRAPSWLARHGLPTPERFFDEETRAMAEMIYPEDLGFYRSQTGASCL